MRSNVGAVLICPDFFDYKSLLTAELERRYASVLSFSDRPHCTSIAKALIKFNILGYAHLAAKKYSEEVFDAIADKLSEIAEVIIVKGTCISPCLIEKIKKISPRTRIICYSWDSISNIKTFPLLSAKADLAYTFDIADCRKYGYGYLPLFYSDKKNYGHVVAKKYKYSFIGSYHGDRVAVLQRIFSHENDASVYVKIFFQSKLQFAFYYLLDPALRTAPKEWLTFKPLARATIADGETLGDRHQLVTTNAAVLCHADMKDVVVIDRNTGKRWSDSQCARYLDEMSDSALSVDALSISTWLDNLLIKSDN